MKRIRFSILLIIFWFLLVACSSESIEKVTIYEMESFSGIKEDSAIDYTTAAEIKVFQQALKTAVKQPGIVNIIDPPYKVNIGEESYFLWVSETSGIIMNIKDTHTIYSLTEKSTREVYETVMMN